MGGRGGSLRGSQGMNAPTAIVRTVSKTPTPTAAAPAAAAPAAAAPAAAAPAAAQTKKQAQNKQQVSTPPTGVNGFAHLTPAQVSALEGAAKQAMRNDPALAAGIQDYTNPRQTANGKAFSQNANWALATGSRKLTKREQAMMDALDKLAKPVGTETTLYRADHDDFLQRLKVGNVQHMTNTQLRRALVGKAWTNNAPESTAYDSRENPFWPQPGGSRTAGKHRQGGSVSGNREVLIRYHTGSGTRIAFIQPSQSEAVLPPGTQHRITGARWTKTGPAYTYGTGKRVLELEIEIW